MKAIATIAIIGTATSLQLSRYKRADYDWDIMRNSKKSDFNSYEFGCMADAFDNLANELGHREMFGNNLEKTVK